MAHLIGQGPLGTGGPTSQIDSAPSSHTPGARARDIDGNEYLYVDFTANTYYGCLVQINSKNEAAPLLGTARRPYRVGVVVGGRASSVAGEHPTSDSYGWVQIYGTHLAVQTGDTTDGTVSATVGNSICCIPQTSVGTPSGVLALQIIGTASSIINTSTGVNRIHNMWVLDQAEVSDFADWPGVSATSGPVSANGSIGNATSGTNTSAFIGQTLACFLNYPYVTGVTESFMDATSDS